MLKDERKTDSEKKQKILDKLLPALQETRALSDVNYPPLACAEVGGFNPKISFLLCYSTSVLR